MTSISSRKSIFHDFLRAMGDGVEENLKRRGRLKPMLAKDDQGAETFARE
jgi:hypothetical protein